MDMIQKLTEELEVKKWQVEAAVRLIDDGKYDSGLLRGTGKRQPAL